ncbi:MAG TPA: cytochrome c oxidase subunit II [Chloroflexota bacterium]|nr:cytochrome c oxidase subunit II [Chloroflexota bacterium]
MTTARRLIHLSIPLLLMGLLLTGCEGALLVHEPRGWRAAVLSQIGWIMYAMATAVSAVVFLALFWALFRPRPRNPDPSESPIAAARVERGGARATFWVVMGGIVMPVPILLIVAGLNFWGMTALSAPPRPPAVVVEIIGNQFWWEVRYPAYGIVTANEVHIPSGVPVEIRLTSDDVIHSFWAPQVHGKLDLVTGKVNPLYVQVDQPGIYQGFCAEYCGIQHAKMLFLVIAESPPDFETWVTLQRRPARDPFGPTADSLVQRGAQVFNREGCINCHAIHVGSGRVGGQLGPDLTHLASRRTIGAGILENSIGNLGGWILNSQAIKPGNRMPPQPMDGESLQALLAYLATLE